MEQIMVSPIKPEELILGKILPYVVICLVTMIMVLLLGRILFGVTITGSYLLLAMTTFLFLFAALGMGVLISSITRSQQMAFQVAVLTSLLPAIILSGFIFPIASLPPFLQTVGYMLPLTYFIIILRNLVIKGAGLDLLLPQTFVLIGFSIVLLTLAALRFKKSLD